MSPSVVASALLAALVICLPRPAAAQFQVAPRLAVGGGYRLADGGVFELAPRVDLVSSCGLGVVGELRTASFETLEAALGPTVVVGDHELAAGVSALVGYGGSRARAAPFGGALLFLGLRHGESYAVSTSLYLSLRRGFSRDGALEVTGGLELGGGVVAALARMGLGFL